MMKKAFILSFFLLTGGCSVGPDYTPPALSNISGWFKAGETTDTNTAEFTDDWWTIFNDPLLEKYIEMAALNNNDVTAALANLRWARALRDEQRGVFFPQVGLDAGIGISDQANDSGGSETLYDAGFDASWEFDLFGGNRRAVEAESARVNSAAAGYYGMMLSTLSEVARTYYEARGVQKRITILEQNSALLRQTYDLITARYEAGEASEFDRTRALGEYQLTQARIPNLQADLSAAVFRLSVLLGLPPESLMSEMREIIPLPVPPDIVPVGIRADVLRRRPDVREAEQELAAEIADIGVETAELFPKFFLTGGAGTEARVFGDIFRAASGGWSLGGLMQWRVFEGGAIRARIEAEKADSVMALANYDQTVLNALADAETALVRYGREHETRRRLQEGLESRKRSVLLARELLDAGEADFLAVLDAERELTATEDTLVVSETQSVINLVALYTSLGGGWQEYAQKRAEEGLADTGLPK